MAKTTTKTTTRRKVKKNRSRRGKSRTTIWFGTPGYGYRSGCYCSPMDMLAGYLQLIFLSLFMLMFFMIMIGSIFYPSSDVVETTTTTVTTTEGDDQFALRGPQAYERFSMPTITDVKKMMPSWITGQVDEKVAPKKKEKKD